MVERIDAPALRAKLKAAVDEAGGVRAYARLAGFTPQYVSDVLLEKRPPSDLVARAFGYEKCAIEYVRVSR